MRIDYEVLIKNDNFATEFLIFEMTYILSIVKSFHFLSQVLINNKYA